MCNKDIYDRAIMAKEYIEEKQYEALEVAMTYALSDKVLSQEESDILAVLTECTVIIGSSHYEPTLQIMIPSTGDAMNAIASGAADVVIWDNVYNTECPLTEEELIGNANLTDWFYAVYVENV